jgi:hypothetical protein
MVSDADADLSNSTEYSSIPTEILFTEFLNYSSIL